SGDLPRVQALRWIDWRPLAHAAAHELGNDRTQRQIEVPTNHVVVALDAVAELAGDVAVLLGPAGEVPEIAGRDGRQVERVLTRIEADRDDAVVGTDAAPQLHRLIIAAERDVAERIRVFGCYR